MAYNHLLGLLSMLKTVVLLNIFVETMIHFFFFLGFTDEWKVQKNSIYLKYNLFLFFLHYKCLYF